MSNDLTRRISRESIHDPSCVLDLPLDKLDGASFMSRDAYGHLCTVTGALWTPRGRSFDGVDDLINCGNSAALAITGDITLAVWFKTDVVNQDKRVLISRWWWGGAYENMRSYLLAFEQAAAPRGIFILTSMGTDATGHIAYTTSILAIDTWYFLVGTLSGTTMQMYLNGVVDGAPVTHTGGIYAGTRPVYLGVQDIEYSDFQGTMGHVLILNRALTPGEISHRYVTSKWRYL